MKSDYFCRYHLDNMCKEESVAFKSWSELMRRGMRAYVECRIEAANIFLSSALDIAILRTTFCTNSLFSDVNITKPAEFLIHLYITDCEFTHAKKLLSCLSYVDNSEPASNTTDRKKNPLDLSAFLAKYYMQLELAEKAYMSEKSDKHLATTPHPLKPIRQAIH